MKNLILSAAALLIGAVSFAQVAGAPTSQVVTALPGAAATANAGESIQNGNNHKVQVRQAGTNQSVYTNQNDGSTVAGGNLAAVYQTGDVSTPSGVENAAEVLQSGEANESTSIQQGDYNNAYTAQGQNDDASTGNKARIQQGTNEQAENNYAAVEQDGTDNQAQTLQTWDNSDAWTRQIGAENKSMINQVAAPEGSDGHFARNIQDGMRNESFIDQSGAGARNFAYADQDGDDNKAKQIQTTDALEGGIGNTAIISQGIQSAFTTRLFTAAAIPLNDLDGSVFGSNFTPSTLGRALQVQGGNDNQLYAEQYGDGVNGGNYVEQIQLGSGNTGFSEQNFDSAGDGNYAKQIQIGTNSATALVQRGSDNKSHQAQNLGDSNQSLISQDGTGNLSNTHQFGDQNVAHGVQRSELNRLNIVQRDGQSYLANQNLDGLGGGNNQIDVMQLGPNGDFSTDGVLCDFDPEVDLNMDYTVPDLTIGDICPDC